MSDVGLATPTPVRQRTRLDGGANTVTVACRLPNGLILQLEERVEVNEPQRDGGVRTITQYRRRPEQYVLNGCAINFESVKRGLEMPALAGGFALTPGIPKEFWEKWYEAHRHDDFVRRGLVFAADSEQDARREAAQNGEKVRGLDPIDPDNPGAAGIDVRRVQVGTTTAE